MDSDEIRKSFAEAWESNKVSKWLKTVNEELANEIARDAFYKAIWTSESILKLRIQINSKTLSKLVLAELRKRGCTAKDEVDEGGDIWITATYPLNITDSDSDADSDSDSKEKK